MATMDSIPLVVLVGTIVGLLLVHKVLKMLTGCREPPGPPALPLIGNKLLLQSRPQHIHCILHELANKYGDVFTVYIYNTKFILLNTHEIIKEVFIKNADAFSTRPVVYTNSLGGGDKGLIFHKGDNWKGIRRTTLSSLRDFGFGKKSMESKILQEASALADVIAEHKGEPFDPCPIVTAAVGNIISSVCFGSRFEYRDQQFRSVMGKIRESFDLASALDPIYHIPILRMFPLAANIKKSLSNVEHIDNFIHGQIKEHRATFDKNNLRDFIDLYIEKEGEDHTEDGLISEANIMAVIRDLFFAGTDTSSTTIRWALVYMQHHPQIQARLGQEMEEVVGSERQPSTADKVDLVYLQAFIMEIMRHASVGYTSRPHLCTSDRQIGGYTIPKGATVFANIYHVHMSERYWKNPTKFNPDRFLDSNGKLMTIKDGFIPFGTGPRQCIAEALVRSQLFLILASLIQRFTFEPADENNLPPLLGKAAVTHVPKDFRIRAIPK